MFLIDRQHLNMRLRRLDRVMCFCGSLTVNMSWDCDWGFGAFCYAPWCSAVCVCSQMCIRTYMHFESFCLFLRILILSFHQHLCRWYIQSLIFRLWTKNMHCFKSATVFCFVFNFQRRVSFLTLWYIELIVCASKILFPNRYHSS